jgi:cytochrome c553
VQACRGGPRQHEVMSVLAQALNDDDINNLAAASIRIEAFPP